MLLLVLPGLLGHVVNSVPINIYHDMTLEEQKFYFGDATYPDSEPIFELGVISKVLKKENLLRKLVVSDEAEDEYLFQAFDINVKLKLKQNDILVSQRASIAFVGEDGQETRKKINPDLLKCLRLHKDEKSIAALSNCGDGRFMGFISTPEDTFEITPLTERLKNMLFLLRNADITSILGHDVIVNDYYIVKRAIFPNFTINDSTEIESWDPVDGTILDIELFETDNSGPDAPKLIETAIFFDHVAYSRFSSIYNDDEIEELLLAYVNQVHALYHVPSLGQQVDIMIIHMEIQKTKQFDNHNGEREPLIESFCEYNNKMNPDDDQANPRHWDVGILLSGLDIWGQSNGIKVYDTLGLARTGAMCHPKYSCVAVELGVWSALGNSYPSTGFSAAYTLAHELGHSLGMRHDGFPNNNCQDSGFIMAAKRGPRGQTQWSSCSGEKLLQSERLTCLLDRPTAGLKWDHNNTLGVPGHFIAADEQCKFYYHGVDKATVVSNPKDPDFCSSLRCRNGDKEEETGPPLEGTSCGENGASWCKEGECRAIQGARWSLTRMGTCRSGCLSKSTGYQEIDRVCLVLEGFEDQDCEGSERWVELCDDSNLCGTRSCASQRRSRTQVATLACEQHAALLPQINEDHPVGKPAKHSPERPWQACSVYCQVSETKEWISPRGVHFPDGTWCHNDGVQDYFCRNHLCLPRNYSFF